MSCTPILKVAKPGLDCLFGVPQNLYLSAFSVIPILCSAHEGKTRVNIAFENVIRSIILLKAS